MSTPFFPCAGARALHAPTRREFLYSLGASLGSVAFTSLLAGDAGAAENPKSEIRNPKFTGHFPAKAKACIFLMMEGGPSHIDTFDPKPKLAELHLQEFVREGKTNSAMESGKRYYVRSPFAFRKHGKSGGCNAGHTIGATDELGMIAIEGKAHVRDLHVTLLRLLGLDDNKLTYYHAGRFKQLSQFGGQVIKGLIA